GANSSGGMNKFIRSDQRRFESRSKTPPYCSPRNEPFAFIRVDSRAERDQGPRARHRRAFVCFVFFVVSQSSGRRDISALNRSGSTTALVRQHAGSAHPS